MAGELEEEAELAEDEASALLLLAAAGLELAAEAAEDEAGAAVEEAAAVEGAAVPFEDAPEPWTSLPTPQGMDSPEGCFLLGSAAGVSPSLATIAKRVVQALSPAAIEFFTLFSKKPHHGSTSFSVTRGKALTVAEHEEVDGGVGINLGSCPSVGRDVCGIQSLTEQFSLCVSQQLKT